MPITVPPISPSGILRYEWVDPDGVVRDLTQQTSPTRFVSRGAVGLGTASSEIADEKLPTAPGSVVRRIAIPAQRIELPITVVADSLGALIGTLDTIRAWFDTGDESRRTPGYLRVTRPDGTIRQIQCYYAGGLEGDLGNGALGVTTYAVSLYAPDPWPTAPDETVKTWTSADLPTAVTTVGWVNEGQLDAYPIWTITGPTNNMSIENLTTGTGTSLVFDLVAGKSVTIDTRPASQRSVLPVLDSDGVNRYPALFPGTTVFGNVIAPGANTFVLSVNGKAASTQVELRYRARYRGMVR